MPTVTVELEENTKSFDVETGTRLVLALENNGVDVSHRCGAYAKCTTCRCEIISGEPDKMTKAERDILKSHDSLGDFRLSCQIPVKDDMTVKPLMRVKDNEWDEPGDTPNQNITPEPEWIELQ